MWRHIQGRAKLGGEPEERKERGSWVFRRIRRREPVGLDRVISSSQPDLLFSPQGDAETKAAGSGSALQPSPNPSQSASRPTLSQLVQSHHKSSSVGSACLERLAEPQLERGAEQPVSSAPCWKLHEPFIHYQQQPPEATPPCRWIKHSGVLKNEARLRVCLLDQRLAALCQNRRLQQETELSLAS